jgi:hypothetical protein
MIGRLEGLDRRGRTRLLLAVDRRNRPLVLFTTSRCHVDVYLMDTATYAATAMLPRSVIQKTEHPLDPEVDFLPFDWSEIARRWVWRFYATGPCNDI